MRAVSTLTAIGTALWFAAIPAHAIGFGRISNTTQLGQPLDFVAAVRLDADETLASECVSADVQSGENRLGSGQIRVALEGAADSSTRSVRVTTLTMIDEPVVTVSVTLGCNSKITRRFVAFVDPPLINAAQTAPAATPPARVEAQAFPIAPPAARAESSTPTAEASPSPSADRVSPPRPRARAAAIRPGRVARAREAVEPAAPKPAGAARLARQPGVTRAAAPGPRLQLETAAPVVARQASAPAPAPVAAVPPVAAEPASAAKPDPVAEQLALERQRIQVLEEGMAKLLKNSQATQASLTEVQARLREAESARYANPLVYALAALSALLAAAVLWLAWRDARARRSAQWWTGPAPTPEASQAPLAAAPAVAVVAPEPDDSPATAADAFTVSTIVEEDETAGAAPPPPRELSVEELIDLEQQAEFFIVLGQDEAAIDLLMSHVRAEGGNSPLPYLKLLEIHRRRGEREAYQRIRERFNRRFNAYAPDWESDPQQGRSLTDYADTIERLQGLWSSPVRTMETLDASLFRRNKTDETFDLPAYRELLFLYSIARDLAEHAGAAPSAGVDLLLPLEDLGGEPIARLSATPSSTGVPDGALRTTRLDIDVSADPAARGEGTAPLAAAARENAASGDPHFIDFHLDLPDTPPKLGSER